MAAALNAPKAEGPKLKLNLVFSDTKEVHVRRPRARCCDTPARRSPLSGETKIEGSRIDLARFFSLIDKAPGTFAIVPPRE
jgi:alkyl sulfatase BDS1-like metallo-beta-lactamase superfamily hydrolase